MKQKTTTHRYRLISYWVATLTMTFLVPTQALAAGYTCTKTKCDLVAAYVQPAIDMLAGLVGIIVVISLIMGGIQYSTAEGDPQKSAKAKDRISKTIIAFVAFFFFYAFMQFLIPGGIFNKP